MSDAYSSFGKRGVAFGFDSLALGGRIRMKFRDVQALHPCQQFAAAR
jgi:hypothetical protein